LKTCSRCGALLAAGDELCARCLLALGRETSPEGGPRETVRRARKRPTPPLEEIAARFPELEVLALIGEGGMGAVYKARQAKIDRLVALKVLGFDPDDHPAFAERFRREGRALARLDHPNVVKLFDFGERDGLFYLVLEFVDGTNLRALMQPGALEPRQALAIVPQICEALQFAHDEGVVHRDIKPENVLVDSKGRVKIADFGLAKLVDTGARDSSLTDVGQVMGTPDYMAPEQLRGERGVDHRADIYSLGVVFYEMLTGELPRGNFALPSKQIHVDVRLDEIVLKTLEVTPELRYQHAVEVKTDVEGVGSAEPRARPAGGGDRPAEPEPGWRWHYGLAFLGLWPLAGWGFNEGPAWWVTMTALVAATFWALLHSEIGDRAGALEAGSRRVSAARQISAALLLVLGFSLLWLGHIAVFDRLASNYRPGPGDPESMQALESRLLPELESRLSLTWPVDRSRLEFSRLSFGALDSETLYRQPWLLLLALASCLAAAAVLGSRWRELASWRGWRVPVRATGSLFGPLLVLHAACAVIAGVRGQDGPWVPVLERGAASGGPQVGEDLYLALLSRDYRVTAEGTWSYAAPDAPDSARLLKIDFADPESVRARWHLSWSGPRRVQPHAVLVLRGPGPDGAVEVRCDLGDAPRDSPERREWSDWAARLLAVAR
jgi:tRNA A-37 threonylcarbamoyl transferase component Bud32